MAGIFSGLQPLLPRTPIRFLTQIGLVFGLALLIGLLVWQGFMEVLRLMLDSGWYLLLLPLAWFPVLLPATQGWRTLFRADQAPTFSQALLALWMGRAVNNLLPVATIGGEVVKARLLTIWGAAAAPAAASVMVDKAVQALSLACWALVGALLLVYLPGDNGLVPYAVAGILFLLFSATGLIVIQRFGMLGALASLAGRLVKHEAWEGVRFSAAEADRVVRELYGSKCRILTATLYRLLSLALHTFELWLACHLLGQPLTVPEALLLRSLTATLSDIAFIIPNAYGVQEGAFILIGALVGFDPGFSLAVSLSLRVRDLVFDPAGLLTLQQLESRRYFRRRDASGGRGRS